MFELAALKEMFANAWPVISVLILSSILSVAFIFDRWVALRKKVFDRSALLLELKNILADRSYEKTETYFQQIHQPIGSILLTLLHAKKNKPSWGREPLMRMADRLLRAENEKMHRYLTGLGTIGSIAPYVGLFGTVVGIIHAFKAIAENSGGGPGIVAHGISEALITTALGLFVAIPAVVAYNLFGRQIEVLQDDMELCVDEVLELLGI